MKEKKKLSLTGQLIITMVAIVAGTVVLCLFFNSTFLTKYYVFHKQKELHSGFERVQLICWEKGEASDEASVTFEKICAAGNINILITDRNNNLVWSSYSSAQRFQMQMEDWLYGTDRGRMQIIENGKNYTLLRLKDERLQSEYLVLLGNLRDGGSVYANGSGEHPGECKYYQPFLFCGKHGGYCD